MVYLLASECGYSYEYITNMTIRQIKLFFEGKNRNVNIIESRKGEDGPETYDWDVGIAP